MAELIEESRQLRPFFTELIRHHFNEGPGVLRNAELQDYIVTVFVEFSDIGRLYKLKDVCGRPLWDVGKMLLEADPVFGPAPNFDRERQVRKHIGDYVLFLTSMFPEGVNHYRLRRNRLENLIDLMKAGMESYYVVSKFEHFEYAKVAPLFAKLSENFTNCVYHLQMVKNDLREMQYSLTGRSTDIFMA